MIPRWDVPLEGCIGIPLNYGVKSKKHFCNVYWSFQAKYVRYSNFCIINTIVAIQTKLCTLTKTNHNSLWVIL